MEKENKSARKFPWKGILVVFICSAFALSLVFSKVAKPAEILRELESYPLGYFFAALFFVLAAWIVDGQRIGMLTRAVGHPIPWWELAVSLGAANFLTLVTPFAGGGGALIVYFLYRRGFEVPTATAVVIAGGMAGQISLAVLSLLVFSSTVNAPAGLSQFFSYLRIGAVCYVLILLVLMALIIKSDRFFQWIFRKRGSRARSKPAQWLAEFRSAYRMFIVEQRPYYAATLAVALCYYGVYYLGGFMLLSGFGAYSPWLRYATSVFFGIAPVFSPIPGGAGISEGIAYLVLKDMPRNALGTFIVLWRTVVFYIPILLGGTVFSILAYRWAAVSPAAGEGSSSAGDSPCPVILSGENDHNR